MRFEDADRAASDRRLIDLCENIDGSVNTACNHLVESAHYFNTFFL